MVSIDGYRTVSLKAIHAESFLRTVQASSSERTNSTQRTLFLVFEYKIVSRFGNRI
jgi:hypothetical protein